MQSFDTAQLVHDSVQAFPVDGADAPAVTIPDAHFLFHADFKRAGSDLTLTRPDGHRAVVPGYFNHEKLPTLFSADGSALTGDVVEALAGSVAPGQYAQAGGAAPGALPPIGRVAVVQGNATAVRNGVTVTLNVGDAVYKGDVIQTQGDAKVGVIFGDGTTFNLAADARMVLNEFIYNPAPGSANSALINLVQGSITFIAGEVAKTGDMRVGTPTATMGIRGTAVQVDIDVNNGQTKLSVLIEPGGRVGSFNVYSLSGQLIGTVDNSGNVTIVTPAGPLDAVATEVQKTPAELAAALLAVQNAFQTQALGQQILAAQPVPPSPPQPPNPNDPNSTTPKTQIQSTDISTTKISVTSTDDGHHTDVSPLPPPPDTPPVIPIVLVPPQPPLPQPQPQSGPAGNVAPIALNTGIAVTETDVSNADVSHQFVPVKTLLAGATDANGDTLTISSITAPTVIENDHGLHVCSITAETAGSGEVARYDIRTNFGDAHISVSTNGHVSVWSDSGEDPFKALGVNEHATIEFTYTVSDGHGGTTTAVADITVNGTNDAPCATSDHYSVTEDQIQSASFCSPRTIGHVLSNDHDVDGDSLSVAAGSIANFKICGFESTVCSQSPHEGEAARYKISTDGGDAHVVIGLDGTITMWSDSGEDPFGSLGSDDKATIKFDYTAADGNGGSDTAHVSINVCGVNDAPSAHNDSLSVTESQVEQASAHHPSTIGHILSNDTDPDGDHLSVGSYSVKDFSVSGLDCVTVNSETAHSGEAARYEISTNDGDAHVSICFDGTVKMWSDSCENPFRALGAGDHATISFCYDASDGHGGSDSARTTITVNGPTLDWHDSTGFGALAFDVVGADPDAVDVDWGDGNQDTGLDPASYCHVYEPGFSGDISIGVGEGAAVYHVTVASCGSAPASICGTSGNDILLGNPNAAQNTFDGKGGNDVEFATCRQDTFLFRTGDAHDTVVGFNAGVDKIDIGDPGQFGGTVPTSDPGIIDFSAWKSSAFESVNGGQDTLIHFSATDDLLLKHVVASQLTADNFVSHA